MVAIWPCRTAGLFLLPTSLTEESPMPTAQKEIAVAELKALMENATIMIAAEYRGLSVKDMTQLRRTLRQSGVEARVVKNKLFQLAANQAGVAAAGDVVEGPSMVIFGYGGRRFAGEGHRRLPEDGAEHVRAEEGVLRRRGRRRRRHQRPSDAAIARGADRQAGGCVRVAAAELRVPAERHDHKLRAAGRCARGAVGEGSRVTRADHGNRQECLCHSRT